MFHLHLWKVLSEVAAAGCNARVFMLTFMLARHKRPDARHDAEQPSEDERRP